MSIVIELLAIIAAISAIGVVLALFIHENKIEALKGELERTDRAITDDYIELRKKIDELEVSDAFDPDFEETPAAQERYHKGYTDGWHAAHRSHSSSAENELREARELLVQWGASYPGDPEMFPSLKSRTTAYLSRNS